jgi:hypothetical protein
MWHGHYMEHLAILWEQVKIIAMILCPGVVIISILGWIEYRKYEKEKKYS